MKKEVKKAAKKKVSEPDVPNQRNPEDLSDEELLLVLDRALGDALGAHALSPDTRNFVLANARQQGGVALSELMNRHGTPPKE